MIPESKCEFLEIFAGPLVDNGVYSMVKSELNNGCIRPLRLMRDFSMISFLVTRATNVENYTIPVSFANSCNLLM
jgi:hypothetical protein